MHRLLLIVLTACSYSCAGTRERAMEFGNTVVAVQMLSAVSDRGRLLAYALAPLSLGGMVVYRAAGGKEYYPRGI